MSNNNTLIHYQRTARILTVACGLLFALFSFLYLYVFQQDLLEAFHYSLAEGKTRFSPLGTALWSTGILLFVRWLVNRLLHLQGGVRELAYFPSCLLLGVLTSVGSAVYQGNAIEIVWMWLLPLLLVLFFGVAYVVGKFWNAYFSRSLDEWWTINTNLLILLLLCVMTVSVGNTDIHFHHELAVEAALKQGDYAKARQVGKKMVHPSRSLTALRMYTLSKDKAMGEALFQYPQLYGAEGLLLDGESGNRFRLTSDSLYEYLGNAPLAGEKAVDYFGRICRDEVGSHVALDYYLSALLLERRLQKFTTEFEALYEVGDTLPRYYEEALFLYDKLHPAKTPRIQSEELEQKWKTYEEKQLELAGTVGEGNRMRRTFGDTYWCYYQYR